VLDLGGIPAGIAIWVTTTYSHYRRPSNEEVGIRRIAREFRTA